MNPFERIQRRFNYIHKLLSHYRGAVYWPLTLGEIRRMVIRERGETGWTQLLIRETTRDRDPLDDCAR